jgi:4-amino-4-deoxy-L-arabinose transferase-like glycosyltransferase
MHQPRSYYIPVLFIVILLISFFRLGAFTLFDVDEAVFSEATKEMVQSGNWLTPTYNGVNRYDKPIFFYWLMALSYKGFGINEFGARFPSAVAGCLLCVIVYFFMRRTVDSQRAFYAVMSLVLSVYFVAYSHAAVTDMTLSLFITLSVLSFYLSLERDPRTNLFLYCFYIFSSLAFLTKGLIGIVFPFGIVMLYMFITEKLSGIKRVLSPTGAVLFLIVSAPWYVAQFSVNGQEFIDQFFIKHHFRRYTGVISGHEGPFYFYIPALLIGLMPWVTFLPAGILNVIKKYRGILLSGGVVEGPASRHHSPELLAMIWFSFIVLFFSFSTTKLPNYILPAVPAAAILIASGMSSLSPGWTRNTSGLISFLSLLLGITFMFSGRFLEKIGLPDTQWTLVASAILFGGAALNFYAAVRKKGFYEYGALLTMSFLLLISFKVLPVANQYLQGALYKYSIYARDNLGTDKKLVVYRINKPSIVFYSDHRITGIENMDQLHDVMKSGEGIIVVTKESETGALEKEGFRLIEKDRFYAILERK